ncbi:TPA: type II toxin-antitoxin system mRNA interferase toxin, RelE/StbE family [Legionella pneumophila]|uniref:type II toxin-antitoxin system RelE/ParE family toxin n=1 Tax=Legionella anisa TaxID=28082 RepID=UPI00034679E1|nr:type II toxin-antitoxin system mRNA interferase toxin, RelE/StbE family [Legionella anisa]AWN75969.1 type II toxin-antitoxin system mRNA interferase toxin, RelE/StbE family [Legionella anisa]MCW8426746.1 type II toxin-antitoxin system mRNA interferase toxin, RelE/StbE family [Legionella anisa]MCW8449441.1 type II toxin-antitoxin system mRNA interferase toxin, RelE/StbE family [Legionella anisa]
MKIQWTRGASQNLKQVESYIAKDNPNAAIDTVLKIIKSVEMLADNPLMGRAGRIFDTRELVINGTPFIVPYRVKQNHIEILRVFHSSRQWPDSV